MKTLFALQISISGTLVGAAGPDGGGALSTFHLVGAAIRI